MVEAAQPKSDEGSAPAAAPSSPRWLEGMRGLSVWAPVAVLIGLVGPLESGWLPGLVALAVALGWVVVRMRRPPAELLAGLRGASRWVKLAIAAMVVLPTMVFCVVGARSIAALLTAFPGAHASAAVALLAIIVCGALSRTRGRWVAAVLGALLILGAGAWGTRHEARTAGAVGSAHSGPVHGIHPFQITAVSIDGYGPFDLPINDFVEPDGSKGYSPAELADAIERALHAIAEVHYAGGPRRAYDAFAHAKVEFSLKPAVKERTDSQPQESQQPRFVVSSGTSGQQSRVEFTCPGRRDDPRGAQADNVMNRMCPDKYASEASAGLGVTGRWPGYVEFRGNERMGLGQLLGWTRSGNRRGEGFIEREHRYWAWGILGLALLWMLVAPRLPADIGAERVGGALAVLAWVVLMAVLLGGGLGPLAIAPIEDAVLPLPKAGLGAGAIVLWVLGGLPRLPGASPSAARTDSPTAFGLGVAAVAVCTLAAASSLASTSWTWPALFTDGGELALERFVIGVAEHGYDPIATTMGWSVFELEGALAGVLVALLTCGVFALLSRGASLVADASAPRAGRSRHYAVVRSAALIVALAAAFVVSRKTGGGSSLLVGAVALTVLLQSSLSLLAPRVGTSPPWRRPLAIAGHLGWVAVAIFFVLTPQLPAAESGSGMHPFVLLCIVGGVATALGAILVLFEPSSRSA